ncbi:TetR family transcriptional regulator [Acrocarpospora catenulata]|uniref:TetR family transcriptional regulator n=1 Tax=Acrocarpospora catenulata TaxID=2836182 RepID=UPI001BD989E5|nr:TetR family transcriptional regulator [Acrocarpospora catenulata]
MSGRTRGASRDGAPVKTSNRKPADERRAEILRCATRLFAAHGFDTTTMDDVASAAKITKRTLYRYMSTKDELLFEIHDSFAGYSSVLAGLPPGSDDPVAELTELIRLHVAMVADHTTEIGVFFEERKHLTGPHARRIEERRDAYERRAVAIIERGVSAGVFHALPCRAVAQAILGAMTEMYRWYSPGGTMGVDQLAAAHTRLFLYGAAADRDVGGFPCDRPPARPVAPESLGARERVRRAATTSFAGRGFHATSMRDLAEVANVTKGAVMYHAGYKNDLLEEIIAAAFHGGIEVLASASRPGDRAITSTHRLVCAHLGFLSTHLDAIAVVNDNMRYLDGEAFARIDRLRDQWLGHFSDLLHKSMAEGELAAFDIGFLTRTLVGMLNSAARWYRPDGPLPPGQLAAIFSRLFFSGISTGPPPALTR